MFIHKMKKCARRIHYLAIGGVKTPPFVECPHTSAPQSQLLRKLKVKVGVFSAVFAVLTT